MRSLRSLASNHSVQIFSKRIWQIILSKQDGVINYKEEEETGGLLIVDGI